jgi:hypothetical protein
MSLHSRLLSTEGLTPNRTKATFMSLAPVALLIFAASVVLTAPALAGSWQFSSTGSGTLTPTPASDLSPANTPVTWTPPPPQMNSYSTGSFGGVVESVGPAASISVTLSVTVKATWIPATGINSTTDPPPPSVWVCESSKTDWGDSPSNTGTCSDGLGPEYTPGNGSGVADSSTAPKSLPPAYWTQMTVSGGVITLPTRTMTASSSFPEYLSAAAGAHVDSYSVTIHAQPYNFHITSDSANSNGTLSFMYDWSSTDGNVANLTSCYWHQYVTYPGANPYIPPLPFYLTDANGNPGQLNNPTEGVDSNMATTIAGDTQLTWGAKAPYANKSVVAQQQWQFDDIATGQTNVLIPGADSNVTITRKIGSRMGSIAPWWYSVTKSGLTAWLQLQ